MSGTATTTATATPRPGTPETDRIAPAGTDTPRNGPPTNPFATPYGSMPASTTGSMYEVGGGVMTQRYFRSRRIKKGSVEQPWKERKDPKAKWITIIPFLGVLLGLGVTGVLIWDGLRSVVHHEYCQILDDNFANGLDSKVWTKEVEVGGYGNGQFEMTTNTDENAFVKDGMLYLKPTLQDQNLIDTNNVINLLDDKSCTGSNWASCVVATNTTNGTIVNPVKSARINTKVGANIKFGRVEVEAMLPEGDWLWPAIWMLPKNNTYGDWPSSGEIDIMESRGNNFSYPTGGNNIVSSTLHFGPDSDNDGWWTTNVKRKALHTTYSKKFHTFGMEWSEKYIFTYVDTRLIQVMYNNFNQPFWEKGHFPLSDSNGTRLTDPWVKPGNYPTPYATPFDEDFYLIINLAVGGTNGWFKDGKQGKPWVDASDTARRDFWNARDQWYPTWQEKGELVIKSVKMWQQKGYNGC